MNARNLLRLLVATCALMTAVQANATVIDFETLSNRPYFQPLPTTYQGVTFAANFWAYTNGGVPYNGHSGIVAIANNGYGAGDNSITFAAPVSFDGAWFSGYYGMNFTMYNAGALVATSSTLWLTNSPTFLSSGYKGLVDRIVINGTAGQYTFDDLQFNTAAAVPEPGSIALIGLGAAGLGLARRKKAA